MMSDDERDDAIDPEVPENLEELDEDEVPDIESLDEEE